ncbi:hypothetical protein UFOVP1357_17 [uncultured Caudovirales phage]|uniref:Uncharacterized protein n=1 Tax=uncultured Caudovirales phage TaxID=2100421 RepID=A0A6J5KXH4_9CAUD|nr:hypothetical protein UFOVP18_55 [uncultured Caudovirales phage]CAB4127124.1 hypothetical protein UFOVP82_57 [uncultured Caudovirales phage]CAB4132672.1 hypothetical protein UFOVP258_48 [uncultured Caudovirales phage]CAB4146560.1 hypothetical protein UFOVP502_40 [uncultured Caudovirales phage]CAB4199861.1 hypothetical protein UFOVP1357_17 [uncultured Caudovirales phage]
MISPTEKYIHLFCSVNRNIAITTSVNNLSHYFRMMFRYYLSPQSVSHFYFLKSRMFKRVCVNDMVAFNYSAREVASIIRRVTRELSKEISEDYPDYSRGEKQDGFDVICMLIEKVHRSILQ